MNRQTDRQTEGLKPFEEPEATVIVFDNEDVITSSSGWNLSEGDPCPVCGDYIEIKGTLVYCTGLCGFEYRINNN